MAGASPHPIHSLNSEFGHHSVAGHELLSNLGGIYSHLYSHHFPPPQHHPPSQQPTTLDEFNSWNQSLQGMYPSVLIGPGSNPDLLPHPQPLSDTAVVPTNNSRKRKCDAPSGDTCSIGGFGLPSPRDDAAEARSPSMTPSPLVLSARRNAACDVWAFTRPLTSDETPPKDEWPTSSEEYSVARPKTPWFGCKLCPGTGCVACLSAYHGLMLTLSCRRDKSGTRRWRVFQNKKESSPTSSFRRHLNDHHDPIWKQECLRLNIPVEDQAKKSPPKPTSGAPGAELFTKEGLTKFIIRFVSSDDQVRKDLPHGKNLC